MTSASCVKDCDYFFVVIGMRGSTKGIEGHIGYPHPGYDSSSHLNDIGIVELDSTIEFGSKFQKNPKINFWIQIHIYF